MAFVSAFRRGHRITDGHIGRADRSEIRTSPAAPVSPAPPRPSDRRPQNTSEKLFRRFHSAEYYGIKPRNERRPKTWYSARISKRTFRVFATVSVRDSRIMTAGGFPRFSVPDKRVPMLWLRVRDVGTIGNVHRSVFSEEKFVTEFELVARWINLSFCVWIMTTMWNIIERITIRPAVDKIIVRFVQPSGNEICRFISPYALSERNNAQPYCSANN